MFTWIACRSGEESTNQCSKGPCFSTGGDARPEAPTTLDFSFVDEERALGGDWPIEQLRREAAKHKIIVCVQRPNHEGLLLRMMRGTEQEIPDAASAEAKLKGRWRSYQKPANAHALGRQFSIDDLLRVANMDPDLETLLKMIGLKAGQ